MFVQIYILCISLLQVRPKSPSNISPPYQQRLLLLNYWNWCILFNYRYLWLQILLLKSKLISVGTGASSSFLFVTFTDSHLFEVVGGDGVCEIEGEKMRWLLVRIDEKGSWLISPNSISNLSLTSSLTTSLSLSSVIYFLPLYHNTP